MEAKAKQPAVYSIVRPSRCHNCDRKLDAKSIVKLKREDDQDEVLCLSCAGLEEFSVIPAGNQKVTRLAKKYSMNTFLVLQWSELWKCYERQGLLVEKAAITQIESELGIKISK